MDVGISYGKFGKIRFALVFFCFAMLFGCGERQGIQNLQVDYEDDKAVGVRFGTDMDVEKLRFFVGKESGTSVIGVVVSRGNEHVFTPAIPFTAGQVYSIREGDTEVIRSFYVEDISKSAPPELLAIYPTRDSVPQNLLKVYLQFSRPMQEVGKVSDFVTLHNDTDDRITDPFLELETELWNRNRTLLTLWFDPGRIKTDLIPNREKGMPLQKGKDYTLAISARWKGANGKPLISPYHKKLYVQARDDRKPDIRDWNLIVKTDSAQALLIDFGEPLDAFLSLETLKVYDRNGSPVDGHFTRERGEAVLRFIPAEHWSPGEYELRVRSELEDLAGNNLDRLFDTDLKNKSTIDTPKSVRSLRFKVH